MWSITGGIRLNHTVLVNCTITQEKYYWFLFNNINQKSCIIFWVTLFFSFSHVLPITCPHLVPLPNMTFFTLAEEWSIEDKVIFQEAFKYHGKNFLSIGAMLPRKPISSLVKYYYLWKRSSLQYSQLDKKTRRKGRKGRRIGWVEQPSWVWGIGEWFKHLIWID